MKKLILGVTIAVILLLASVIPTFAAPLEEWELFGYFNDAIRVTMTINPTTLKTDHFDVYNRTSDIWLYLYVRQNDTVIWENYVPPNTDVAYAYSINFSRLPKTDPDNPDSIRYPAGVSFGSRTQTYAP